MTNSLFMAFALMLVLEGLMPFVAPAAWRETFRRLIQLSDGQIRFIGLSSMVIGIFLLMVFRGTGYYPNILLMRFPMRRLRSSVCAGLCSICSACAVTSWLSRRFLNTSTLC